MKKFLLIAVLTLPGILKAQFGFLFENSGNVLLREWSAINFFNDALSQTDHISLLVNKPYFIPSTFRANVEYGKRLFDKNANIGIGYGIFAFDDFNTNLLKISFSKDISDFRIGGIYYSNWLTGDSLDDTPFLNGGLNIWTSYSFEQSQAVFMVQYVYPSNTILDPSQMRLAISHNITDRISLYCDLNHFLQRGFYAKIAVDLNLTDNITIGSGFTLNGNEIFFSFIYSPGQKLKLRTNGSFNSPLGMDVWADGLLKVKNR